MTMSADQALLARGPGRRARPDRDEMTLDTRSSKTVRVKT